MFWEKVASNRPQETSEDIQHWLRQGEAEKLRIELLGPVAFEIKSFWINWVNLG